MVGRKKLFLIVMLIISSILMTISLFGPWYSTKMAYEEKYDGGSYSDKRILDYHFTESQFHHELSGESRLYPGETNELPDNIVSYSSIGFRDKQKFVSTMETAQNLALIGLLFALIILVVTILFVLKIFFKPSSFNLVLILIIISVIFILVPPIYLMTALPMALENDENNEYDNLYFYEEQTENFFGTETEPQDNDEGIDAKYTFSWGGGWGFWACIIAAIINCIEIIIFVIYKKRYIFGR